MLTILYYFILISLIDGESEETAEAAPLTKLNTVVESSSNGTVNTEPPPSNGTETKPAESAEPQPAIENE